VLDPSVKRGAVDGAGEEQPIDRTPNARRGANDARRGGYGDVEVKMAREPKMSSTPIATITSRAIHGFERRGIGW
jgi:hypothetical protein